MASVDTAARALSRRLTARPTARVRRSSPTSPMCTRCLSAHECGNSSGGAHRPSAIEVPSLTHAARSDVAGPRPSRAGHGGRPETDSAGIERARRASGSDVPNGVVGGHSGASVSPRSRRGAWNTTLRCRQCHDPLRRDRALAVHTSDLTVAGEASRVCVEVVEILPCLTQQGDRLGALVGDGRPLGIVLIVGRRQLGAVDDRTQGPSQRLDLADRTRPRVSDHLVERRRMLCIHAWRRYEPATTQRQASRSTAGHRERTPRRVVP